MAEEEVDFSKLSLEDRCTHKNWKARVSAYDELNKTFQKIYEEKSPEWSKYGNWVRKFPTDSNAAAQEKALEVTLLYLQNAGCAGKIVSEVMSGVVSKCITAAKAKSKELASEIALMCVEIEKQEQVQDELAKGMEQKNPKVVAGCIAILTLILREFGAKVINLKPLVKKIPTLAEDRDKTVREETKKLIIELYRWISSALKPQLAGLKPVMLQELDAEFEKVSGEKPQPKRLLRSQQARAEEIAHGGGGDEAGEEAEDVVDDAVPEIDPYDLMEAVDILSKIPKDFYEKCEAKKWQERKEALEALEALIANPKIEPGDFSDIVRTLKKLLAKDTNILVVTLAGKCLGGLAIGLKRKFSPYAVSCIGTILEKFKEKKANVVAALRIAIDAACDATHLEAIHDDVIQALQNKSPAVKTETNLFLARTFAKTPYKTMSDKKLMKGYFSAILTNLNESDPGVRDAAAEAMGVALKYLGDKNMAPFMADLDQLKTQKVKEFAEKAVIIAPKAAAEKKPKSTSAKSGETNGTAPPKKGPTIKKPSTAPAAAEKRSVAAKANRSGSDTNLSTDSTPPPAAAKGKPSRATMSKPAAKSPNSKKTIEDPIGSNLPVNSPKHQRIIDETRLKILRWQFTSPREEFIELLKELMTNAGLGKTLMTNMFSADFKMHIRALDTLLEELNHGIDGTVSNLDLILKWLTLRFFDTNPTVLIRSLDYLNQVFKSLSEVGYQMPDVEANAFIPHLMMKIGDPKENVKSSVHNILRQVTLVHSPHRIFTFIMEGIKSKNARQRAECLEELANMISTLGVSVIQPTPASGLKEIAKQISDRDNGVRNAALNAVVQVYYFEGDRVYKMIGQLPDKIQSLLDERIKRAGKRPPPQQAPPPQQPPPLQRPNQSSSGSNNSSPNSTTMVSPQGNSKLIPPSVVSNTILQPQNLNSTVTTNYMDADEDMMMMPPPVASQNQNIGQYQPPQDAPKAIVLPEKYRVDFDAIENMFRDDQPLPPLKLHDTNIERFMKEKPPALPSRRMVAPVAPTLTKDKSRASQAPSRACQSIDLTISQVGQTDLRSSMEALTQLDGMISDGSIVQIMSNRVDHMLSMTSLQIHRLQATIESASPERLTEVNKFYRCAVAFLTSLYKGEFLPQKASKETIKDLIQNLLYLIIDPSLERLPDAAPIVRLINIMVVRIIEKSDPNAVTCALIRLLNETLTASKQPRMLDLVMKCQWKLLKQFSVWEQWKYEWDVPAILTEFNLFMRNHPFSSFQGQDITPLKTMKTILHALVVHLGGEVIAQHLSFMPEVQESEAGLYINKVIQREMSKKRHGSVGGTPNSRNNAGAGGRTDSVSSNNVSGRTVMADNYNQVSNPNNNVNDFMNSLPDPSDAPTDEAQEQVYYQRVRMILMRGGLSIPRGPSVTLSKNLNDGGEESSI